MCRCLQSLWEDFYWNCIEEKFCFDETIAYYNPEDDEEKGGKKKSGKNSFTNDGSGSRKQSEVVLHQPLGLNRQCSTISSKMHEDELQREIQTAVPILAPEVLSAFAHSQIFHDSSQKQKTMTRSNTKGRIFETEAAEKLLSRLEGDDEKREAVKFHIPDGSELDEFLVLADRAKAFDSIAEEDESDEDSVNLRSRQISASSQHLSPKHKPHIHPVLKHVQSVPHFPTYPRASTADGGIYTIPISMTPEIPTISLKALPRNYQDTPSIEHYRESSSLTSIQMENKKKSEMGFNFQMPRYYGHSDLYLPTPAISQEEIEIANANAKSNTSFKASLKKNRSMLNLTLHRSLSTDSFHHHSRSGGHSPNRAQIPTDKGKRLKLLRGNLPPLMIQSTDKTKHKDRE